MQITSSCIWYGIAVPAVNFVPCASIGKEIEADFLSLCSQQESADRLDIDDLRMAALQWVVDHGTDCFRSDSFLDIQAETLVLLLKSDKMAVEEDEIWRAVVKWGRHKCQVNAADPLIWTEPERAHMREVLAPAFPHIRVLLITGDCWVRGLVSLLGSGKGCDSFLFQVPCSTIPVVAFF